MTLHDATAIARRLYDEVWNEVRLTKCTSSRV
jgi:hypothetical protein